MCAEVSMPTRILTVYIVGDCSPDSDLNRSWQTSDHPPVGKNMAQNAPNRSSGLDLNAAVSWLPCLDLTEASHVKHDAIGIQR